MPESFRAFRGVPNFSGRTTREAIQAALNDGFAALDYQSRVDDWMQRCMGPEIAANTMERNYRFLEESLELAQANGCTREDACRLVDYVFGRPIGEIGQEVGGVMVTLAALCTAANRSMRQDGETELMRINDPDLMVRLRAKQASKPIRSPLPGAMPPESR